MKHLLFKILILSGVLFCCQSAVAQRVAVKTNALDWLTLTPNISLEARLNSRLTLDIGFAVNPVTSPIADKIKPSHFRFQPELRYWFNRPMARHFVGFAPMFADYNVQWNTRKYQGDLFAFGFNYGYALVLNRHWNVEFSAGVGIGRIRCYKYTTAEDRPAKPNYTKWAPMPVDLSVSFAYIFN